VAARVSTPIKRDGTLTRVLPNTPMGAPSATGTLAMTCSVLRLTSSTTGWGSPVGLALGLVWGAVE
jgi:hypothetical protein